MTLKAYTGGLPESAVSLIEEGLAPLYSGLEMSRLGGPSGKLAIRKAVSDRSVVFVCLDAASETRFKSVAAPLYDQGDRYFRYSDDVSLADYLRDTFGAEVSVEGEASGDLPPVSEAFDSEDLEPSGELVSASVGRGEGAREANSTKRPVRPGGTPVDLDTALTLIENLQDQIEELSNNQVVVTNPVSSEDPELAAEVVHLRAEVEKYKRNLESERSQVRSLEETLRNRTKLLELSQTSEKDWENRVAAQRREIQALSDSLSRYQTTHHDEDDAALAVDLQGSLDAANQEIGSLRAEIQTLERNQEGYVSQILEMTGEASATTERIAELERDLRASGSAEDSEVVELLKNSVYGELLERTGWSSAPPKMSGDWKKIQFRNIMFIFSGSKESNVDVYRRIREFVSELVTASQGKKRVLFADFGSDSFASYVFKPGSPKNSQDWLNVGGDITPYTSATDRFGEQVRVYSLASKSYVNDFGYYDVDWLARLQELDKSGYRVVAYMGDLSSLAGRSFYLSLAGLAKLRVYAKGSISGADSLYRNLRGLASTARPSIYMYDVMEDLDYVQNFIDWLTKNNYRHYVKSVQRGR